MIQVAEVMTRDVRTMEPNNTLAEAARAMQEMDVGVIPVCEGERLVGVVTDRDIVVRGVAEGLPVELTLLDEVMTSDPETCFEDEPVEDVIEQMRNAQVRRLPVIDREQHVVGLVALGDLAVKYDDHESGEALSGISEPAAPARL